MSNSGRRYGPGPGAIQSLFPPFTPAVKGLVIACAAVFAVQILAHLVPPGESPPLPDLLIRWFGLVPAVFLHGALWQVFSYLFLHGGIEHLALNMLGLWMFGSSLEIDWGARRFLGYYFLTGIGAGLFSVALGPRSTVSTVGASGAIFGLIVAFAVLHPNRPIFIWGIFPVKAKWFALAALGLTLSASWRYSGEGIAHVAHLGGMIVGYAYLKRIWRVRALFEEIRWRIRRRRFRVIQRRNEDRWNIH